MLAAQMVMVHRANTVFMRRALAVEQTPEGCDRNVNRCVRLMRMFAEQAELLHKLRGKSGQQRVVVEHVNVQSGG